MPNLSLLSRGTGQVVRKTQEKLEVHFEPEVSPTEAGTNRVVFWPGILAKVFVTILELLATVLESIFSPPQNS